MYLKVLEMIARGEIAATDLGLPEPAPTGFSLPNDEFVDVKVSKERRAAALKITLARTPAERWEWGMAWREFVLHLDGRLRDSQVDIEAGPAFTVSIRTERS